MMKASGYAREVNDWYREPAWIVEALAAREKFVGTILDPACGGGTIPTVLKAYYPHDQVFGSDKVDRGYGPVRDFLNSPLQLQDNIVSNPPYGVLEEFVERAIKCTNRKVCVIGRLAFLESMKRKEFFEKFPLSRVWVSRKRVSMPPGGTDIKAEGGTIAYAWFVWDKETAGQPPILGWV